MPRPRPWPGQERHRHGGPVSASISTVAQTRPRRSAKSSIPTIRGTAAPGRGILRRTRSAVSRETTTPTAASNPADARPANSRATALTWAVSREIRRWQRSRTPGTCSRKVCTWQPRAGQRIRRSRPHHDAAAANRHVHRRPLVIAALPGSLRAALVSAAIRAGQIPAWPRRPVGGGASAAAAGPARP